jgi:hypothetical protein
MFNIAGNNASGYNINNSLRTRASASAYLNRTTGTPTLTTKFTWSGWIKRGQLSTTQVFYSIGQPTTSANYIQFQISSADQIIIQGTTTSASVLNVATNAVFRDPSAWYHVVVSIDTTQATAANRVIVYINGVQQTLTITTQIAQNATIPGNTSGYISAISSLNFSGAYQSFFDGYLAEVNFIDGQALTPSSFGSTDAVTGQWLPKKYSGTYGTNGFYLKFSDIAQTVSSNVGLGKDFSTNTNFWVTNNISVTAGVTYDAMTDSPTLGGSASNYAVLNALAPAQSGVTLSNGNLRFTNTNTGSAYAVASTFGATDANSGEIPNKFYFEATLTQANTGGSNNSQFVGVGGSVYRRDGTNAGGGAFGATYTTGDIIGVADDVANSIVYFYKNNVLQGSQSYTAGSTRQPQVYGYYNIIWDVNFGQRPFTYTPPTGYKALNTYNLPNVTIPKGNTVMDATLYTGTGANATITNAGGFKPDLVWVKVRSTTGTHVLTDSNRGANKQLFSNLTNAEATSTIKITGFTSTGFTLGADNGTGTGDANFNGSTYVGWQWQAGQGSTSSNTNGSITSTVSVNTTAGFSVVTYTGTGANATVGHGLGVAPAMVIVKRRNSTGNWNVRHVSITAANSLYLNLTNASQSDPTVWNSTVPTSTVFSIGTDTGVNASGGTYVGYCWAEIAGFSKFGSYTGNGSTDGAFVYLGFRPKFVLVKNITTGGVGYDWYIIDSTRNSYNQQTLYLKPNTSGAEENLTSSYPLDFLSNGFKMRNNATGLNGSGGTMIYMAFAENPFKNSNAR